MVQYIIFSKFFCLFFVSWLMRCQKEPFTYTFLLIAGSPKNPYISLSNADMRLSSILNCFVWLLLIHLSYRGSFSWYISSKVLFFFVFFNSSRYYRASSIFLFCNSLAVDSFRFPVFFSSRELDDRRGGGLECSHFFSMGILLSFCLPFAIFFSPIFFLKFWAGFYFGFLPDYLLTNPQDFSVSRPCAFYYGSSFQTASLFQSCSGILSGVVSNYQWRKHLQVREYLRSQVAREWKSPFSKSRLLSSSS